MPDHSDQTHCANLVRRHDPDRWLTASLAPAADRERLLALYALHVEVSHIAETVTEPMAVLIRFQWWREALDLAESGGEVRNHPVLRQLAPNLAEGRIPEVERNAYLDALEADLDGLTPQDLAAFEAHARTTGGSLSVLAARLVGVGKADALDVAEKVGTAHAMIARMLNAPWWASQGRNILPSDPPQATRKIAARAGGLLAEARAGRPIVPPVALPVLMIARITSGRIRRLEAAGFDVTASRAHPLPLARSLAVLRGALTGRY
ncbi:MAG TPA: squalene/phytoene synthase family protein [Alphaproteobacteria bacterium]|nr:squalene/phytoene synthase family protein [Alphaproteobacteria bacterium]